MSNRLASSIRTWWPLILGHAAVYLVAYLAGRWGVQLDSTLATEVLSVVAAGLVYEAGRWLERRRGGSWLATLARPAGRWLLSLGLRTGQPVYSPSTR